MSTSTDMSPDRSPAVLLRAGLLAFSQDNLEQAHDAWNRVLDEQPDHPTATDYLTHDVVTLTTDRDAVEAMRAAPSVRPAYADALDGDASEVKRIVVDLLKQGRLEEAFVLLREIPDRFSRIRTLIANLLTLRYVSDLGPLDQAVHCACDGVPDALSAVEQHVLAVVRSTQEDADRANDEQIRVDDFLAHSWYAPFLTLRAILILRDRGLLILEAGSHRDVAALLEEERSIDVPLPAEPEPTPPEEIPQPPREDQQAHPPRAANGSSNRTPPSSSDETERAASVDSAPDEHESFEDAFRTGVSMYVQGNFDAARRCFNRCMEIRPGDPRARRNLERIDALQDASDTSGDP